MPHLSHFIPSAARLVTVISLAVIPIAHAAPPPTIYAQYTASAGVTTNGSGTITRWVNQTGVPARDLANVIGTPKTALYSHSGGSAADVVSLDGSSALWATATNWGSLTGDRSVVARIRLKGSSNGFLFDGSTSSGKTRAQIAAGTWQTGVQSTAASFTSSDLPTTVITVNTWQTHVFEFDDNAGSTTVRHFIDGVDVGGGGNVALTTALGGLIVGANGGASGKLNVEIAELLVYNRVLSASEKTDAFAYLQNQWGDLVDLPFDFASATVVQTPQNVSFVGVHGIAALKITSSGNAEAPGYALTQVACNLGGTTDPGDIAELRLYAGGSSGTFDAGQAALLATLPAPGAAPLTFALNQPITATTAHFWIAAKMKGTSQIGDTLDAKVTSFVLTGAQAGSHTPDITAPVGALTVNSLFYSTVLHAEDQGGIHIYRIPGMVTTNAGTIIASFDIRYTGGPGAAPDVPADIDIGIRRSTDGGITWTPMQIIIDYDKNVAGSLGNGVCDPCVLVDRVTGRIWCAGQWSKGNNGWNGSGPGLTPDQTGQFVLNYSDDDGVTWSAPVSITPAVKNPAWNLFFQGPGKGICTRDGTLVFPAQYKDGSAVPRSNFIFSTDRGVTWITAPPAIPSGSPWTTEAQIVELDNGNLLLSMRNHDASQRRLWCVYSWNHATQTIAQGSWGTPWFSQTDPTVMGSLERYRTKRDGHPYSALLFANPDSTGRNRMSVRVSLDEGLTWPYKRKIDDRPAAYSCMTILPDGDIGLLYETGATSSISDLVFARFPIEWIIGTTDTDTDGMPDFFEDATGLNKASAADAALDSDGDGKSNLSEYQAGTNPFDASSRFEIQTVGHTPDGLHLKWTGVQYATYRVEVSPSLAPGSWQTVPGLEAVARTSTTGDLEVELPFGTDPRNFYRIALVR